MLLEIRDLDVEIGSVRVADGLELALEPGQSWGVLGPNGVGKTTLLLTLAGVRPPRSGEIRLDGRPLARLARRSIARRLGMLTQHIRYAFDASCLEVALTGRHPHLGTWSRERPEDLERARRVLGELGLGDLAERSCMALSGGELRRLSLATVLVQDPAVLLLDEPTNHLDPANQIQVLDRLWRRIHEPGKGLIMALHDVNLATCYCTHVLMLMGNGEWRAGPTAKLLTPENLSRLYHCPIRLVDDGRQRVFAVSGAPGDRFGLDRPA